MDPLSVVRGRLRVAVRLSPGAGAERIEGVAATGTGPALKVAVTAPPEGGKANAALLRLLARAWGLPKGALSLAAGAASRSKSVEVAGEPEEMRRRISARMEGRDG